MSFFHGDGYVMTEPTMREPTEAEAMAWFDSLAEVDSGSYELLQTVRAVLVTEPEGTKGRSVANVLTTLLSGDEVLRGSAVLVARTLQESYPTEWQALER